jgi:hypothetical protein
MDVFLIEICGVLMIMKPYSPAKSGFVLAMIFLFIVVSTPVGASYITMDTQTSPSYDGKRFKMTVDVTNRGDESAYNVQVSADINGQVKTTPPKNNLEIKGKHSVEIDADLALTKAGRYPVVVNVDYTDANQYPFSAMTITHFVYRENLPSQIFGTLQNIEISTGGSLALSLKNLDEKPKDVMVRLVLPKELSSSNLTRTIPVKGKSEEKVHFDVKNFSALPGSSYSIFAIMGYDEGDLHYSASVGGNIKVTAEQGFVKSNQRLLIGVAVALGVIFVYFNIRAFWGRKSKLGGV